MTLVEMIVVATGAAVCGAVVGAVLGRLIVWLFDD